MKNVFALNHTQITNLLLANREDCLLIEGEMGIGKSALLKDLAKKLPDHIPIYLDCNTMGVEDAFVPNFKTIDEQGVVSMVPNEQLGLHLQRPVILMIDEYGKGNPGLKNAMTRIMNEAEAYGHKLHPESIRFATTNLGAENIGDLLMAHQINRVTRVEMRKPDADELTAWGANNGMNFIVMGWIKDTPQALHTFRDYENPEENPYIFHPQSTRSQFVTPRGLMRASRWFDVSETLDKQTLTAALIGTVGNRSALDMMAWWELASELPRIQHIKDDPMGATVPTNPSAVCMTVYKALSAIDREWVDQWVQYMQRLPLEAQSLFVGSAMRDDYSRRDIVAQSKEYGPWAVKNHHLFSADKK